jgi:NAD(P)-dependent dehydrogenase (short-subunit alcohol dehydrogenase family)
VSIERKVAIITGASHGLGAELVRAYRNRSYRVVANSRSIAPSRDSDVLAVAGDIADPATAERVIREALALFGRAVVGDRAAGARRIGGIVGGHRLQQDRAILGCGAHW